MAKDRLLVDISRYIMAYAWFINHCMIIYQFVMRVLPIDLE